MSELKRAKQFMSFDALKGFKEALLLKEYEHESVSRGERSEEIIEKMTKVLRVFEKGDVLTVVYFEKGHQKVVQGKAKVDFVLRTITIKNKQIEFDDVMDLS